MRASDADRDRYAAILQQAYAEGRLDRAEYDERLDAVLGAKTYAQLQPLVADLPSDNLPVLKQPAPLVPAQTAGTPMVAVFSSVERKGVWNLPEDSNAVAVFGSVQIDVRRAQVTSSRSEIRAVAVFGSVEVIVTPGTPVEVTGVGVFGEFNRSGKVSDQVPDAPALLVSGLALFGSVTVKEKA
ncbi:MAG: DUF1707 domain-containing protein [Candidatus Nanopelagicales bacterium]